MKRGAVRGIVVGLSVNGLLFAPEALPWFSWGFRLPGAELLALGGLLAGLLALLVALASPLLMISSRTRALACQSLAMSLVYFMTFILAWRAIGNVDKWGCERIATRSKPLIAAIEAYEAAHGTPPGSLEDLVPRFLPEIPRTGLSWAPEYVYEYVGSQNVHECVYPDSWSLHLDTSQNILNWDIFYYTPEMDYPKYGYGGYIERIGDWAYVHE